MYNFKRIFAVLMLMTILFGVCSCANDSSEESAIADEIVVGSEQEKEDEKKPEKENLTNSDEKDEEKTPEKNEPESEKEEPSWNQEKDEESSEEKEDMNIALENFPNILKSFEFDYRNIFLQNE